MTATLHKILAGDSYRYYLRQVAAADATDRGPGSLSDYYSAHGERPGTWWGNGLAALNLSPGDEVTEAQMRALFGQGRHPDTETITARIITAETVKGTSLKAAGEMAQRATRLGNPYRTYSGDNEFRKRCGVAFSAHNIAAGVDARAAIPDEARARIRTDVATEMFIEHYERPPLDDRELSGFVAKISRPKSAAVAGFDITFSPVKSVSALWAIAPIEVSERVASAHDAAVDDALGWLQEHGIFTRAGRNGVRQLDVDGIVAARFVHRESRCGDPDLHTHVLIANRVRGADGRWRTLDAAVIYRLNVTISEIYNTRLEHHLRADLGVEFTEHPGTNPSKRPIREIDGIPPTLIRYWSRRDAAIRNRLGELTVDFHQQIGREPTPVEVWNLAQVATLQTRPAKHLSRSWAEQRRDWRAQAVTVLGDHHALDQVVATTLNRAPAPSPVVDEDRIADIAGEVVEVVSAQRSVWQHHHIRAETERRTRALTDRDTWASIVDSVVGEALSPRNSLARGDPEIAAEPDLATVPEPFQRRDGASVYTRSGSQTYTSAHQLDIEYRLAELSVQPGARTIDESFVAAAIDDYNTDPANQGKKLNAGQTAMVTRFAISPARIAVASAPAGTGKTTAMRVLVDAWCASGGTVLGLAPEAAPAAVLAEATRVRVETVDRLLHILNQHRPLSGQGIEPASRDFPAAVPRWVTQIDDRTLVIIDEHIKLSDRKRLQLFEFLTACGATIRCVGDDKQLPAIDAGGAGIDFAHTPDAITLTHVVRFADTAEATVGLALRDGDPSGLGFYLDHRRIHSGSAAAVADKAYGAWFADQHAGRDAIMLAPTHDIVTDLNDRARADRLARTTETTPATTLLADGLSASAGDIVCTRRNNRGLPVGERDWVRNGYRWRIDTVHPDGTLTVTHLRPGNTTGATTVLPASYVGLHVRLGYAMTIDSAQGTTADTCHTVLTGTESRNQLYVAVTRGIHSNHLYVPTTIDGSEASFWTESAVLPHTAVEVLQDILAREATPTSAHTALRDALDPYRRLGRAVDIYLDAVGVATEHALGPDALTQIDHDAETLLPGLTDAPAYPTLRQHLAILALAGHDPATALCEAIDDRELDTANDPAAVLDWRLDTSGAHSTGTGPLPWLHGLPQRLSDPAIAGQLHARRRIVADLTTQITTDARTWVAATAPVWARPLLGNQNLIAELAVWRAAHHVPDTDLRPTGPARFPTRERDHQARLNTRVTDALGDLHTATHTWEPLAKRLDTRITSDPWWPVLAAHLDTAAAAGLDIDTLLTDAATPRPLPDDMPAAALWSRLRLDPAALTIPTGHLLRPDWTPHLHDILGPEAAEHVINDPAWPRLVAAIDTAPSGWTPHDLIATAHELLLTATDDNTTPPRADQLAIALAWRVEILTHHPTENTTPTTETDATMAPKPSEPDENPTARPVRENADPAPAAIVGAIGELVSTGRLDDARHAFTRLTAHLHDTDRDLLRRVITTLSTRAYPVAVARLRWAADHYPDHRAFILAAIPTTDPHLYQPIDTTRPTHDPRTAARDHREWTDQTRRRPPRPDRGRDAFDAYTRSFADLDVDPAHLPVPEGTGTTRHQPARATPERAEAASFLAGTGYTVDYDRYAVADHHGLPCLSCGLERALLDTPLPPDNHCDDGLCSTCRDDNRPGIPDHNPVDHMNARCTFITTHHSPAAALSLLRKTWRHTTNPADRATIETFARAVHTPSTATEDPNLRSGFDPTNPIHLLTDAALRDSVRTVELRIHLADDEATMYGPAPGTSDATNPLDTHWLAEELTELQAELTRRAHLTPEQSATEDAQRTRLADGSDTWSRFEPPAPEFDSGRDGDGPEFH
ncbi:relaxase domain-containing protein [Nocardia sp. BSTN01]|uniref:MobF family relaxase n=1 Tax=Nocardia sp. BSTN01 TaxID=2783665 RepID=UPI00188F918D|nr:MobF family relaxase [Nocardia sp. BSTN01]MBF4999136.1 relaxase domain-containing protein [Nocardia sp. BSTN01]